MKRKSTLCNFLRIALPLIACLGHQAFAQWCLNPSTAITDSAGGFIIDATGNMIGAGYLGSPVDGLFPVLPSSICAGIVNVANVGDVIPAPVGAVEGIPPLGIDPSTGAWWQDTDQILIANEASGLVVNVTWSAEGGGVIIKKYQVLAADPSVYLYKTEGDDDGPLVDLSPVAEGATPAQAILHYNAELSASDVYVDAEDHLHASANGILVIEYQSLVDGSMVDLEVVQIKDKDPGAPLPSVVGQEILPSWGSYDYGRIPVVTTSEAGYIFQYLDEDAGPSYGRVYPIDDTADSRNIEIFWFEESMGVYWPAEVRRYTSTWPEPTVKFFLSEGFDDGPPVDLSFIIDGPTQADVILHYNHTIEDDPIEPDAFIIAKQFHARDDGLLLLEYRNRTGEFRDLIDFEVVNILPVPVTNTITVDVGTELLPSLAISVVPDGTFGQGVATPHVAAGMSEFVYQQQESIPGPTRWDVYAIQPTSSGEVYTDIVVYWFKIRNGVSWPTERRLYKAVWPDERQTNVRAQSNDPAIEMGVHERAEIQYQQPIHANISGANYSAQFTTAGEGIATVMYTDDVPLEGKQISFEVVETIDHLDLRTTTTALIGDRIEDEDHDSGCNAYLFSGTNYDPEIYTKTESEERVTSFGGTIIPVNTGPGRDEIEVWWYQSSQDVCWPVKPVLYQCEWPAEPDRCIIIANEAGSGSFGPSKYGSPYLYYNGVVDGTPTDIGFNPNEEHAVWNTNPGDTILAARDDLNALYEASEPYVLMRYQDREDDDQWDFEVIRVEREVGEGDLIPGCPCVEEVTGPCTFNYERMVKQPMRPPLPLGLQMTLCPQDTIITEPTSEHIWDDDRGGLWFSRAGSGGVGTVDIVAHFYERWEAECRPWLDDGTDIPIDVTYTVSWPEIPYDPEIHSNPYDPNLYTPIDAGETLDRSGFRRAEILYNDSGASLIMPWRPTYVSLDELPGDYIERSRDLPPHIRARLDYDMVNSLLVFKGKQALGLLGIMSTDDRDKILEVFNRQSHADFQSAVGQLYAESQQEGGSEVGYVLSPDSSEWGIAISGGAADATGYIVIGYNGHEDISEPVQVEVLKLGCPPFRGEVQVIYPDCPFDEQITLRWSGDCGGDCSELEFYWQVAAGDNPDDYEDIIVDVTPTNPFNPWEDYVDAERGGLTGWVQGQNEIIVKGANVRTLTDNWFRVRTRGYREVCGGITSGGWTSAELAEGWIKRVKRGINPFDQRVKSFHEAEVATYVSMIEQLGTPLDDILALTCTPEFVNNMGLIEIYQAVLGRGKSFTIDLGINYPPANQALLLMAGSLADFYMLLGNEAYGDAQDPTVGVDVGTSAPASAMFCFQDQLPTNQNSLIYEELALLRGRDDTDTDVSDPPIFNRLHPNFSLGDGQVAYVNNYNITDKKDETDSDDDGVVNEPDGDIDYYDAQKMFPQGHGDAWGHYLTALKFYYELLRHEDFEWPIRTEFVRVGDDSIRVSFAHERKFARASAAKAKCGAEITELTYRAQYLEDPSEQCKGYPDPITGRNWGVSDWSRRSFVGSHLDWVTANSMLLSEDVDHAPDSVQRVDRTTVAELREIASSARQVQSLLDEADAGLNPLGLQKNVVPFDIDPAAIAEGKTHFEQIYERAAKALNNTIVVFDYANDLANSLRRHQDELEQFERNVEDREADFNNRLIEVFGYPYPEDKDPLTGDVYGVDYNGPDLYHWAYVDVEDLLGLDLPEGDTLTLRFATPVVNPDTGVLSYMEGRPVEFNIVPGFGMVKPRNFTLNRKAPGEIQLARSDLLQINMRFQQALDEYDQAIENIEDQAERLQSFYDIAQSEITVRWQLANNNMMFNDAIEDARANAMFFRFGARLATLAANTAAEFIPTAVGLSNDVGAPVRGLIKGFGVLVAEGLEMGALSNELSELEHVHSKEYQSDVTQIRLAEYAHQREAEAEILRLEQMIRALNGLKIEIYTLQEAVRQASGRYLKAVSAGERLLDDLIRFRRQTATQITEHRYKDMAFRVFRNDALQKYRAQFDLASMYVYLAAKAYDYETSLLSTGSAQPGGSQPGSVFLEDIVRERMIGEVSSGLPVAGRGLAGVLAQLSQNFDVLKPQLGFNNPQTETNRFSLRYENFRIGGTSGDHNMWQRTLEQFRVADLRNHEAFIRYCNPSRDIVNSDEPEPALVIPLGKIEEGIARGTTITSGLNYFGWPLSGGDSTYSSDNFATKIRSVGIWFSNYNATADPESGLTATPRVYLVPVGADVMRVPSDGSGTPREWFLVDQVLPAPFDIQEDNLTDNLDWLPALGNFGGSFEYGRPRRFGDFRAYHDGGSFNPDEVINNNRLIGRSVWNTRWLLIIPGRRLHNDPDLGLDAFIHGDGQPGDGVTDIKLFFQTYAYQGS